MSLSLSLADPLVTVWRVAEIGHTALYKLRSKSCSNPTTAVCRRCRDYSQTDNPSPVLRPILAGTVFYHRVLEKDRKKSIYTQVTSYIMGAEISHRSHFLAARSNHWIISWQEFAVLHDGRCSYYMSCALCFV